MTSVQDYWPQRKPLLEILRYLATMGLKLPHWQVDAKAAQLLAGAVEMIVFKIESASVGAILTGNPRTYWGVRCQEHRTKTTRPRKQPYGQVSGTYHRGSRAVWRASMHSGHA